MSATAAHLCCAHPHQGADSPLPPTRALRSIDGIFAAAALPEDHPHALKFPGKKPELDSTIVRSPDIASKLKLQFQRKKSRLSSLEDQIVYDGDARLLSSEEALRDTADERFRAASSIYSRAMSAANSPALPPVALNALVADWPLEPPRSAPTDDREPSPPKRLIQIIRKFFRSRKQQDTGEGGATTYDGQSDDYERNLSVVGDDRRRPSVMNIQRAKEVQEDDRRDSAVRLHRRLSRARPLKDDASPLMAQALEKRQQEKALFRSASKQHEEPSLASTQPGPSQTSKKRIGTSLESWSRYPSHTREERCGSAGSSDRVIARDFAEPSHSREVGWSSASRPKFVETKTRWDGKAKHAKALPKRISSSIVRYYSGLCSSTGFQGKNRRTSVTAGGQLEHPELEMLPPQFATSPVQPQQSAEAWAEVYRECVRRPESEQQ